MQVLLTRSIEENRKFKKSIDCHGLEFHSIPLITYQKFELDFDYLKNFDVIIITSKFAASILPSTKEQKIKVRVVGSVSASILKEKGYCVIQQAKSAKEIKGEILKKDHNKTILYLRGNHISTSMPDFVLNKIFYKTSYLSKLTNKQIDYIKQKPEYILLYSKKSAQTLFQLISNYNLENYIKDSIIIAMSNKIANILSKVCANVVIKDDNSKIINYLKSAYEQKAN